MLKANITDGEGTGRQAAVENASGDESGALIVATRPLKHFNNAVKFFLNDDYGADMNVTITPGAVENIHDGTDNVYWTGSEPVGSKWVFDSTDEFKTGSKSVKCDNATVNDIAQFAKGSDVTMSNYVSLTMWIYVDKDWKNNTSVSMYGYDTATASMIGDKVYLEDYFAYSSFDVWQKISIPMSDFGAMAVSTIVDSMRIQSEVKDGAKNPEFYLDDIELEETGAPVIYELKPTEGTWLHVHCFTFSFADDLAGTLLNGTMPVLNYLQFLGEKIQIGITYKRSNGGIIFSQTLKSIMDILQLPETRIESCGSDGTNTFLTISADHYEPFILKHEHNDTLSFTVNDSLAGLLHCRISAGCKIENRV